MKQRFDYSCGAVAVATVLHHFYRLEVDEATIIDKIGLKDEFSFADLARVMAEYALKAVALDFDHLQRMMVPAIVYLDFYGEGIFRVYAGSVRRRSGLGIHRGEYSHVAGSFSGDVGTPVTTVRHPGKF